MTQRCTDCKFFKPYTSSNYLKSWPNGGHCEGPTNCKHPDWKGFYLTGSKAKMTIRHGDGFYCASFEKKGCGQKCGVCIKDGTKHSKSMCAAKKARLDSLSHQITSVENGNITPR